MVRRRIHGERSLITKPHPTARYADSIQLIRWRRGPSHTTWEAKVRLPDGRWTPPFSLGTDDDVTAAVNAVEQLAKRAQLQTSGLPQPSRTPKATTTRPIETFGDAAQVAIERLTKLRDETLAREGRQKAHKWSQHLRLVRNVLMPAFGDLQVKEISRSYLNDWMRSYRTAKGGSPHQNTVGNFNHSFQFVMQVAVERGWLRSDDLPTISKKGFQSGQERPWFTANEMEKLRDHMTDDWVADAHKGISAEIKYLLRAYVALGSCTGIRPGLEIERIRVNQILFETDRGAPVIRIPILRDQGKYKNSRDVYAFENDAFDIRMTLLKLIEWRKAHGSGQEALLFSRPSDGRVAVFSPPFKHLMHETGLLFDPETQQERVPYSLRHYFATQALLRGEPDHIVAKWMGTSAQMIDRHYNKIKLRMRAAELAGTRDKLARARAANRRHDAALRNEPVMDEYEPGVDDIMYGSNSEGRQKP